MRETTRLMSWLCLPIAVFAVNLTGCSGGREAPQTAPVSGTVFLNGKPLPGAEVRFYTNDFVGYGITNSEGKYELSQGAVPGQNRVTVATISGDFDEDPESGHDQHQLQFERESALGGASEIRGAAKKKLAESTIPPQYADPEKTVLEFQVPEDGATAADFRLTSK